MKRSYSRHGKYGTRVYKSWWEMIGRCNRPQDPAYKYYGGRGIKIHWKTFDDFYADMGDPPDGMFIERIDNSGDYCKANCKWADKWEQAANKRNNRLITFDGQTKHLAEWSRQLGIKDGALRWRLKRWPLERAFTAPHRFLNQTNQEQKGEQQ